MPHPSLRRLGYSKVAVPFFRRPSTGWGILHAATFSSSSSHPPALTTPVITSVDPNLPSTHAIDFVGDYLSKPQCEIIGNDIQSLRVTLFPGQVLRTESASLLYSTDGVAMETSSGGGMGAAFKRYVSGSNAFVTDFRYDGEASGVVCLGPDFPSQIRFLPLPEYGGEITCSKGSMVAMGLDVSLEPSVVKGLTAGIFGGEGFIMQKLTSDSAHAGVYVKGTGSIIKLPLSPGSSMRIATGALVAYTSSCLEFEVETLPGVKNALFGQGLFVTKIRNESDDDGHVWVQGLESGKFVSEIGRRLGGAGGGGMGLPIFMGGGGGSGGEGGEGAAGGPDSGAGEAAVQVDRQANTAASVVGDEVGGTERGIFGDEAPPPGGDEGASFGDVDDGAGSFEEDDTSFSSDGGGDDGGGGGLFDMMKDIFSDD